MQILYILAGVNGAMAVGMGAHGWHSLGGWPDIREIFMMGSEYQMYHAIAIAIAAPLAAKAPARRAALFAATMFQLGTVLFSGTLYTYGLANTIPLEGAAPVGGGLLMAGWLALAWGGWKLKDEARQS